MLAVLEAKNLTSKRVNDTAVSVVMATDSIEFTDATSIVAIPHRITAAERVASSHGSFSTVAPSKLSTFYSQSYIVHSL